MPPTKTIAKSSKNATTGPTTRKTVMATSLAIWSFDSSGGGSSSMATELALFCRDAQKPTMQSAPKAHPAAAVDWDALDALKYQDEEAAVAALLADAPLDAAARASVNAEARALVTRARDLKRRKGVMESFLEEFGLSNAEGLALMCLAEALLRVPDEVTADKLIAEKIRTGRWDEHLGKSDHWLVNAGTWGLMLTGRIVNMPDEVKSDSARFMANFV